MAVCKFCRQLYSKGTRTHAQICLICFNDLQKYKRIVDKPEGYDDDISTSAFVFKIEEQCKKNLADGYYAPKYFLPEQREAKCRMCGEKFMAKTSTRTCQECKLREVRYRSLLAQKNIKRSRKLMEYEDYYYIQFMRGFDVPKVYAKRLPL